MSSNPFARPSPFKRSLQPSSLSSPYSNLSPNLSLGIGPSILESQVRPVTNIPNSRPSITSGYAGTSGYGGGYSGLQYGGDYKPPSLRNMPAPNNYNNIIPTHDTNSANLGLRGSEIGYSKDNPFKRSSLLGAGGLASPVNNNSGDYYGSILGSGGTGSSAMNIGGGSIASNNSYDHLRYTPSSNQNYTHSKTPPKYPTQLPRTDPNLSPIVETSRPYYLNNYNTDKSDTGSVCTYINKISDIDDFGGDLSPRNRNGNPFNRKNIIPSPANNNSNSNNVSGGYKYDNEAALGGNKDDPLSTHNLFANKEIKDYSHLQYNKNNNKNDTLSGSNGLDKYKYQYQLSKKNARNDNNNNRDNKYGGVGTNKYDINNEEDEPLGNKYKKYGIQDDQNENRTKSSPYSAQAIAIANDIINNKNIGTFGGGKKDNPYTMTNNYTNSNKYQQKYQQKQRPRSNDKKNKYQFEDYHYQDEQSAQFDTNYNKNIHNPYTYTNNQKPKEIINPYKDKYDNNYQNYGQRNNINNNNNKYKNNNDPDLQYNFNRKQSYEYQLEKMEKMKEEEQQIQKKYNQYGGYNNSNGNGMEGLPRGSGRFSDEIDLGEYDSPEFGRLDPSKNINTNTNTNNRNTGGGGFGSKSNNNNNIVRFDEQQQPDEPNQQSKPKNPYLATPSFIRPKKQQSPPTRQSNLQLQSTIKPNPITNQKIISTGNNNGKVYPSSIQFRGEQFSIITLK